MPPPGRPVFVVAADKRPHTPGRRSWVFSLPPARGLVLPTSGPDFRPRRPARTVCRPAGSPGRPPVRAVLPPVSSSRQGHPVRARAGERAALSAGYPARNRARLFARYAGSHRRLRVLLRRPGKDLAPPAGGPGFCSRRPARTVCRPAGTPGRPPARDIPSAPGQGRGLPCLPITLSGAVPACPVRWPSLRGGKKNPVIVPRRTLRRQAEQGSKTARPVTRSRSGPVARFVSVASFRALKDTPRPPVSAPPPNGSKTSPCQTHPKTSPPVTTQYTAPPILARCPPRRPPPILLSPLIHAPSLAAHSSPRPRRRPSRAPPPQSPHRAVVPRGTFRAPFRLKGAKKAKMSAAGPYGLRSRTHYI